MGRVNPACMSVASTDRALNKGCKLAFMVAIDTKLTFSSLIFEEVEEEVNFFNTVVILRNKRRWT